MPTFFATTPKGIEPLLAAELAALGVPGIRSRSGGVAFDGNLATAYRVCLWSRTASRVLLGLCQFPAADPDALYAGIAAIDWSQHLDAQGSLVVDCVTHASQISHSQFAALKVKDAIVDQFRERTGVRPSVDRLDPDLRVNLYLHRDTARLSLDLSGASLHRRGYRSEAGPAPLKENLAAALLLASGWPELAAAGRPLTDPMCGSGTLLIEGAMIAADVAPGLGRAFGFERWRGHDAAAWQTVRDEAELRRCSASRDLPAIAGSDQDGELIERAKRNAERAGVGDIIHFAQRELPAARPPAGQGLMIVNPPYGERLGGELESLYRQLGDLLRQHHHGWQLALFTGNPALARQLRIKPDEQQTYFNGAIECRLLHYRVEPGRLVERRGSGGAQAPAPDAAATTAGGVMLENRLRKNLSHLGRWARRNGVTCFRLYDADLPEFNAAIDLYQSEQLWAVVQEYEAPAAVEADLARQRLAEIVAAVARVLDIPAGRTVCKQRQRQRDGAQYAPRARTGQFLEVQEDGLKLQVNLHDYLDTGLFLDHRATRASLREQARGQHMLNLFCYTAVASLHAAAGGALTTTSVDLSATYLDWARRNFERNGFSADQHRLERADCSEWLTQAAGQRHRYGLIFIDPPTFSRSKRMEGVFDVQADHAALIRDAMSLLEPDGLLVFSNNFRGFKLDPSLADTYAVTDISARTIAEDFRRNPRIHRCWEIRTG